MINSGNITTNLKHGILLRHGLLPCLLLPRRRRLLVSHELLPAAQPRRRQGVLLVVAGSRHHGDEAGARGAQADATHGGGRLRAHDLHRHLRGEG